MAEVEEEIASIMLRSFLSELMASHRNALKRIVQAIMQAIFDASHGFENAEVESRIRMKITQRDLDAALEGARDEGIDLRIEEYDPSLGPDAQAIASIPVSQITEFTRFWERSIEEKMVSAPAAATPPLDMATPDEMDAALEEVGQAFRDEGGAFEHSLSADGEIIEMKASAAPGRNLADTTALAAAAADIELDGVGEFDMPSEDFEKIAPVAEGLGAEMVKNGTDLFGRPSDVSEGRARAKVRERDAAAFKQALSKAAAMNKSADPAFAERCEKLKDQADRRFSSGRVAAAPRITTTVSRGAMPALDRAAAREGLSFAAEKNCKKDSIPVSFAARDVDRAASALMSAEGVAAEARIREMKEQARRKSSSVASRMRRAAEASKHAEEKYAHDRNRMPSRER